MGPIVDVLGFLTGIVLYVMLVAMVWRERLSDGLPFLSSRSRLPLLTGFCGILWNVGALISFGPRLVGTAAPNPAVVSMAFSALGCLPAVVVHSLLEGREVAAGRVVTRVAITAAYSLSVIAAVMHGAAAIAGDAVPSRPALWLLTGGFTTLLASLLFVTRRQPVGRRGVWVAALAIFAVSALHFGRHSGNETWWVELIGHHASLALALAILHQDYRFAFADLFLKNAIAVLLLMVVSVTTFAVGIAPLMKWQGPAGDWDPRAVVAVIALWMGTALVYPAMRRIANRVVDRAVLRRPDYDRVLRDAARTLALADTEPAVLEHLSSTLTTAFGAIDVQRSAVTNDWTANPRPVVTRSALKTRTTDATAAVLLTLATVDAPHPVLSVGQLAGGRRVLSDDVRCLETLSTLAARRIDSLRVEQERFERDRREERIAQLATEAELRALRAQLNPHFLFNALTTIGYLIHAAPARAVETLLRLTTVLRGVLRRSTDEFSTLAEELDLVRSYVEIERARFEERLEARFDVAPDALSLTLPTLLVQPLVENAIKHGLAPQASGGAVEIRARRHDTRLIITITDTGKGFHAPPPSAAEGVGLSSVAQRLAVHYGADARLDIQSRPSAGTTVTVDLPARAAGPRERRRAG